MPWRGCTAKRRARCGKSVYGASAIVAITNGVHQPTWQAPEIAAAADDPDRLWNAHLGLKHELIKMVHEKNRRTPRSGRPDVGFARRAAGYKRGDLILRDPDRLAPLLRDKKIQIVFSGKSHPADTHGKALVTRLVRASKRWHGSIVFIENYGMDIAKKLVSGCDIWLNNPERPKEASGTSGMKAALNGVPNLSILDGWWPEGCVHGETGWAIGNGEEGDNRDHADYESLMHILEGEVLSTYAHRESWVRMMAASIRMAEDKFTAGRMVREYYERLYPDPVKAAIS